MDLLQQFPQAAAFTIPGKEQAILMVHGFTSTPNVFAELARYLHEKTGWEIRAPLLPGHGTNHKNLDRVKYEEWMDCVETEFEELGQRYKKIHLIGISMGGTLCAHLSTRFPTHVSSLTLLAPGLFFRGFWERFFLPIVRQLPDFFLQHWVLHKPASNLTEKISYHDYSVKSVMEFDKLTQLVRSEFDPFAPCLIMVPTQDKTIHPKSSEWFMDHIHHRHKKLVELEQSPHIVFLGTENSLIFSEIETFLKSI